MYVANNGLLMMLNHDHVFVKGDFTICIEEGTKSYYVVVDVRDLVSRCENVW